MMKVLLAADHGGYSLKEGIKPVLDALNILYDDQGTFSIDPVDDYPDLGYRAALRVSKGEFDRGVLICGSGIGMSMVANKVPGVRAALCMNPEQARLSRSHNDANILVLAGWLTSASAAEEIVRAWFGAEFEGGRHRRRVDKIRRLTGL